MLGLFLTAYFAVVLYYIARSYYRRAGAMDVKRDTLVVSNRPVLKQVGTV